MGRPNLTSLSLGEAEDSRITFCPLGKSFCSISLHEIPTLPPFWLLSLKETEIGDSKATRGGTKNGALSFLNGVMTWPFEACFIVPFLMIQPPTFAGSEGYFGITFRGEFFGSFPFR